MNESGGNTAQHNAYYGPLLRQDIHQQKKCLFLSFLIYSFSTNLLGTYSMPGAVVDPRGEGWVGTRHRVVETDKETMLTGSARWRKWQGCG